MRWNGKLTDFSYVQKPNIFELDDGPLVEGFVDSTLEL
jgi:hypothetical protein